MSNLKVNGSFECESFTGGGVLALLNRIYPINSIYMSVGDTSPASFLGGTWEKIKDKFLLSSGDTYSLGATGGEATHTLTIDEIPSHSHYQTAAKSNDGSTTYYISPLPNKSGWWETFPGGETEKTGGSQAHNNMPPYLVVNVWKRIS